MIALPESGTPDEVQEALLLTWDTRELVDTLKKRGAVVQDWSIRRGWVRMIVVWHKDTELSMIVSGAHKGKMIVDLDEEEMVELVRAECMEHFHFIDHTQNGTRTASSYTVTVFFKIPIFDDPQHAPYFQLPTKVAAHRQQQADVIAFAERLMKPLCVPDILPERVNPKLYQALVERAQQVFDETRRPGTMPPRRNRYRLPPGAQLI